MTINELLEIVDAAYPDGMIRLCWDANRQQVRGDQGDTLAEFVVREIVDTFDADALEENQLDVALSEMRWACTELDAVIRALEERRRAYTPGG